MKLSQMNTTMSTQDSDNPMMNSMKTMTYTMPLISVVFGFTLPAGLGLYWVASAAVRSVQQLAVNKYLKSKSVDNGCVELNYEVRLKEDDSAFVNELEAVAGVSRVVLVSYNGDYMG